MIKKMKKSARAHEVDITEKKQETTKETIDICLSMTEKEGIKAIGNEFPVCSVCQIEKENDVKGYLINLHRNYFVEGKRNFATMQNGFDITCCQHCIHYTCFEKMKGRYCPTCKKKFGYFLPDSREYEDVENNHKRRILLLVILFMHEYADTLEAQKQRRENLYYNFIEIENIDLYPRVS